MQRMLEGQLLRGHPADLMAFVVGPRQVGKTTLAQALLTVRGCDDFYRNWDDVEWRREVARSPYGFIDAYRPKEKTGRPLVVLDEIHKFPRWKQYLKGLWDTRKTRLDVLVTGSGRLDVYQRGGDSLLGRYRQYRLHPLTLREVVGAAITSLPYDPADTLTALTQAVDPPPAAVQAHFARLLRWGGFPRPFVAESEQEWRLWHRERRRLIVREDLRDLTRIQLLSHVEELVELLVLRAGGMLSYNSLREDLQVALDSVRLWVGYLTRLYFIYLLRPYAKRVARAIRREPKVYLWDWSEIADEGARFENLIASHLLKWCHFCQDWGYPALELHFVRDKEKREVDFLVTKDAVPWLLIEAKLSDPVPSPALHHFAAQLGVTHKFMVVRDLHRPGMAGDVHVLDAVTLCHALPV